MKERSKVIDIMKGIGIILMVVGHAGCPTFLYNFIYTFHMALFFMISGWLISGRRPNLTKRIKALYWPFLLWGILSLIMQYPLYKIGIYSKPYNFYEYISHLIHIFTFAQTEPIVGPLWFLKSLFFSYLFVSFIVWLINSNKYLWYIAGLFCFIILCLGFFLYKEKGFIFYNLQREMMIPWLLWLGYSLKTKDITFNRIPVILFLITLLAFGGQYISINLISSKIGNPIILTLFSIIGFISVYNIAYKIHNLNNKVISALTFIGRNSMPILILHFICIKLIQVVMNLFNIDVSIGDMQIPTNQFWALYSIIGIVIPLLFNQLYIYIKR